MAEDRPKARVDGTAAPMRSIAGAFVLLIVLAVVGLLALRQTQSIAPAVGAASGGLPGQRAQAAQQRAAADVARAMEAASASRDAAEAR